jgi:hypothetical protein
MKITARQLMGGAGSASSLRALNRMTYDGPTIVERYLPDMLKAAEAMQRFLETRS